MQTRLPAGALRVGAVLAASGPVILRVFRLGPADMNGMICWGKMDVSPFLPPRSTGWELLSWAELLLPVVLAGLLLRASRRTTSLGVTVVCAVLAFRLLAMSFSADIHPLTGQPLPVGGPWPPVICYSVTITALLLAARSPLPSARKGTLLWAAAAVAAAWTIGRLSLRDGGSLPSFGWFAYIPSESLLWGQPGMWSCKADADGLLIVLLALAAATGSVLPDRPRRRVALGVGALLALAAFKGFVAVLILLDGATLEDELHLDATMMIRWHLLVAAMFVIATTFRKQAPSAKWPLTRAPGAGSCSTCVGQTSTSTASGSPSPARPRSSTASGSREPPRAAGSASSASTTERSGS